MRNTIQKSGPLLIIAVLFFIFGFVTWLNAALIPFLRIVCELSNFQAYFVTFAFYIAYFVFAIPTSAILKATGFRKGISIGLFIMGVGAIIFLPAAIMRSYFLFLSGLFTLGAGLAILQSAANPYVAILGSPETAARRISIMGMCNKFAGAISPIFLGRFALKDFDEITLHLSDMVPTVKEVTLNGITNRLIFPYLGIALVLFLLSYLIKRSPLPEVNTGSDLEESEQAAEHTGSDLEESLDLDQKIGSNLKEKPNKRFLIQYPRLLFGIIALFFYVGAEVISIDSLLVYATEHAYSPISASRFPLYSMIALMIGYFIGVIAIPHWLSQQKALFYSAFLGLILCIPIILFSGKLSIYALVALGLANALVWPCIWGLSLAKIGKHIHLASSLLIMSIAGGAIIPLFYGYYADRIGLQNAYWILLPCYLVILLYSLLPAHKKAN